MLFVDQLSFNSQEVNTYKHNQTFIEAHSRSIKMMSHIGGKRVIYWVPSQIQLIWCQLEIGLVIDQLISGLKYFYIGNYSDHCNTSTKYFILFDMKNIIIIF